MHISRVFFGLVHIAGVLEAHNRHCRVRPLSCVRECVCVSVVCVQYSQLLEEVRLCNARLLNDLSVVRVCECGMCACV